MYDHKTRLACVSIIALVGIAARAPAQDCNNNAIPDGADLIPQNFGFEPSVPYFPKDARVVESRDEKGRPIDFNGDGFPDLVVAGNNKNIVSVLLGRGDGTFSRPLIADVDVQPRSMAVADFDRDGELDVATANRDGRSVSILYGIGGGRFEPAIHHPIQYGGRAIVAGDFNNDEYPDLAVTRSEGDRDILILMNDQGRSFSGREVVIGNVAGPRVDIAAADMDHDGSLDLVVLVRATRWGLIVIMPGQGDGTFPFRFVYPLGFPWWEMMVTGLALADLDGDGDLDIAASNAWYQITGWGDIRLLENLGDFDFGEWIITDPLGPYVTDIVATDFDLDGDIDLAVAMGTFCCSEVVVVLNQGFMNFSGRHRFPVDNLARSIASGDFDLDGRADLATANGDFDDTISVLLGTTDGPAYDHDCNLNDIPDGCDIAEGRSEDCNDNGFPDECEPDCNHNGVPDDCDVDSRESRDGNRNGIPDECEGCFGDFNRNGERDEIDLLVLEGVFGCRVGSGWPCDEADIDGDGQVNPLDLGLLQALMGPCPDSEEP